MSSTTRPKPPFKTQLGHRPHLWLILGVVLLAAISYGFGDELWRRLSALEDAPTEPVLALIVLFGVCSVASHYATWKTPLPSFVVAVALGVAGHALFRPILTNPTLLASLVTSCAAIILFGGGLEMPLRDFMRLFGKIALLALPGVLITGYAFSSVVGGIAGAFGLTIGPAVIILLGAVLASTDPAAIIPVVEHLRFKRPDTKNIVIAESALNDVAGALLTSMFFKLPLTALTLSAAYASLASASTFKFLMVQVLFGVVFGLAGYGLLWLLNRMKRGHGASFGADHVYFLATPILAFAGASAFGGSGFLAAFISGLVFHAEEHLRDVERYFFSMVDGVAKPVIFVLVGAMVDLHALLEFAWVGIAAALIFMFVVRPAMVFLTLGGFSLVKGEQRLTLRELLFISFVRETGAIPAVLLVTAVARITTPLPGLVEIGMWVILLTLALAPPLTPFVARRLGVVE
jgi:cell volume regulation protein A